VSDLSPDEASTFFERRRAAWLAADVEGYLDCFTEDLEITVPGRDEPLRGRERYERLVRRSFAWASPESFEFHHLAVGPGATVLAEWSISTRRRDDGGITAWRGMSVCALRDGRIAWWREYWDPATLTGTRSG
jgi:ketosteroid isomerase-like protein